MTTDRDTLREEPTERERIIHRLNVLLQKLQDEWLLDNDNWYGSTHTIPAIMQLIDAHDNALLDELDELWVDQDPYQLFDVVRNFIDAKRNQVFRKGETNE